MTEKNLKKVLLSSVLIILLAVLYIVSHSLTEKVGKIVNVQNLKTQESVSNVLTSQINDFKKIYHDGLAFVSPKANVSEISANKADFNSSKDNDHNKTKNVMVRTVKDKLGNEYVIKGDVITNIVTISPVNNSLNSDINITISKKGIK